MIRKSTILLLTGMILTITATASLSATIKVGGGGAACKGFVIPLEEAFEAETGISLDIKVTTPAQGLIELNDGHIDVAASAVSFGSMIKGAEKNGITIDPSQYTRKQIGVNKTLVFLHKSNKVNKLSKKQLKDIFTGKITNWKQVGGANQQIVVVWGTATPGQNELFTKEILDGEHVTEKHQELTDYKSIRDFVAKNPESIGIDPQGFVNSATKNPKIQPITSPVIAVTKGKPSPDVEKLLQYIQNWDN